MKQSKYLCRDKKTLLIFLRYPTPGKVKTRLAREVGAEKATQIYEKLLRRTLGIACDLKLKAPETAITLCYTPQDPLEKLMSKFQGPWQFEAQQGDNLGHRMANAFQTAFAQGAGRAVLIGTDLADVEAKDLEEAFRNLAEKVAVLGPAADGGFYLVGVAQPVDSPFDFTTWGTDEVFSRTARKFESEGFRVHLTPKRSDVDRKCDLERLDRDCFFSDTISVIIPTLNQTEKSLSAVRYLQDLIWPGDEIVLVSGRGFQKTVLHRVSPDLTVVETIKGRGIQQNAGAMLSRGNILFFLHDDTIPPPQFPYLIRRACRDSPLALGCFRLSFLPSNLPLDLVSKWANLRTLLFNLPYGDQGLFCRKELFERAGGFTQRYLMEDVKLAENIGKISPASRSVSMLPQHVGTSPDRYLRKGVMKASLQNHLFFLLSALGRPEQELYRKYYE